MLNRLKTYLKFGTHFCGIEHTTKEHADTIVSTLLKTTKNGLEIKDTFQSKSIEELSAKLPKKQHAFLVINTNQVLSKTIESTTHDAHIIVNKAFPNINLEDFYYEILQQNKTHFVSLCRQDYIQTIIKNYKKHGVYITDIGLGNLQISSIRDYIEIPNITSSNASISFKHNDITSIRRLEDTYNITYSINSLEISNNNLLSFSGALQPVLKNNSTAHNSDDLKFELINDYKHTRFFSEFLKYSLGFFLVLLLVNFFFFNHYHSKVESLNQVAQVNSNSKALVLKLNEDVTKKENMVTNMLKSGSSKSSFYANTIMQSMPNSILLSEFNYQPLLKRIKTDKTIEINNSLLLISGSSNSSDVFSNWITELEALDWIEKIDINYGKGEQTVSDFTLNIALVSD